MKQLADQVAVVTGAASGIGRALADAFAAKRMKVVLADIEQGALDRAAAELTAAGAQVLAVRTDVSRPAEVDALARRTVEAFGGVHVLCNNAGVAAAGLTWEIPLKDWEWVLGVNLWGVLYGVRSFVPLMLAQGGEAHIVNTASMAGLLSIMGMGPYGVAKHSVVTMSETLLHELNMVSSGRVGVSVLCPGWVNTQIHASQRNRPADAPPSGQANPMGAQLLDLVRGLVSTGLAPAEVAAQVVHAIETNQFYILTHPHWNGAIKRRMEDILEGRAPTLPPPMK